MLIKIKWWASLSDLRLVLSVAKTSYSSVIGGDLPRRRHAHQLNQVYQLRHDSIYRSTTTPTKNLPCWRRRLMTSSRVLEREKFSITEADLSPNANNMALGKFERLDSTGSGSSLNGEDITKPFLIGVAGGTASGKVSSIFFLSNIPMFHIYSHLKM